MTKILGIVIAVVLDLIRFNLSLCELLIFSSTEAFYLHSSCDYLETYKNKIKLEK